MDRPDVLIVGAGPVGLALALGLARAGRSVLVLEKESGTAEHSRAPAIWPRTQEILADLGVLETFLERGIVRQHIVLRDADQERDLLTLPLEELEQETPWPQLLIVPQSRTERLLAEAVQGQAGAALVFSAEVTRVEPVDAAVRVTYRRTSAGPEAEAVESVEAAFVVGCDGAHSVVREAIGGKLEGVTYDLHAALADIAIDGADDLPFPRISTRNGLATGIRIDERLWRLILPFAPDDVCPLDERVARAVKDLFPPDVVAGGAGSYESVWQSEFRLHRRMSSRFVDGRIALAGDAAHLNSPVGGQGMNAGIQDAEALTAALLRAFDDDTLEPLVDYERRRREIIEERVNRFTDRMTRLFLLARGRFIKSAMRVAAVALHVPAARRQVLRRVAMLDQEG